jgi:hypothetical protein
MRTASFLLHIAKSINQEGKEVKKHEESFVGSSGSFDQRGFCDHGVRSSSCKAGDS